MKTSSVSCSFAIAAILLSHGLVHADSPTFSDDIAPILKDRCVQCHRTGEMAPMPLTSYDEVRPWVKAIRREVTARQMPPFNPSGELGRYLNDLRLTDSQIETTAKWVDAGAPRGPGLAGVDTSELPPPGGWPLGEPDLILELPAVVVPAETTDFYRILYSAQIIHEDTWVDALDWNVGNRALLHHAIPRFVSADAPVPRGMVRTLTGMGPPQLTEGLAGGYLPGSASRRLPEGEAVLIPANTRLTVEAHYSSSGPSAQDQTRIGLHLANGWRKPGLPLFALKIDDIKIAPGDSAYSRTVSRAVDQDLWVYAFRFHMHRCGESGRLALVSPDGREEELIAVPNYKFDWQHTYRLTEPKLLPRGSDVRFTAVWNNSESNLELDRPLRTVRFGPRTEDEMGGGHLFVYPADDTRTAIYLVNGRQSDPPEFAPAP